MPRQSGDRCETSRRHRLRDEVFPARDADRADQWARSHHGAVVSFRDGDEQCQPERARIFRAAAGEPAGPVKRPKHGSDSAPPEPFHNPFANLKALKSELPEGPAVAVSPSLPRTPPPPPRAVIRLER